MTPDQYRRAPIPADGRTIEAMRLALLDTPAGRAMTNAGDTRLYWMNESDAYMLMSPFGIESPFINTPDAVSRLVEAARAMRSAICGPDGFAECVRRDSGLAYPWPALEIAESLMDAALAQKAPIEDMNAVECTCKGSDEMCPCQNTPHPAPDAVARLVEAARAEAEKAMRKFPQPNYVISKVAEEAGEVVKAAIHCAEGRETPENVKLEIVQAMAMLIRLYVEGDQVHGLPALAAMELHHDHD